MHGLEGTCLEMLLFWADIHSISKAPEFKKCRELLQYHVMSPDLLEMGVLS